MVACEGARIKGGAWVNRVPASANFDGFDINCAAHMIH